MRKYLLISVVSAALGVGCSSTGHDPDGGSGSGGVTAAGGRTGAGGEMAIGGRTGQAGATGTGGRILPIGGRTGQAGETGTGGSSDGGSGGIDGGDGDASVSCATAVAQGACSVEGAVCNSGCTDVCQFCNLLRCTSGHWQPQEVAPAPCFACGPTLRCQTNAQYCHVQEGGAITNPPVYQCRATPATCLPTPTCTCLRNQGLAESVCSEGDAGAGQVTTRLQVP